MTRLRPGHADLAGVVKYGLDDVRNVLERASARETASRVAAGRAVQDRSCASSASRSAATCAAWARCRRRRPTSSAWSATPPADPWWSLVEESPLRTGDKHFEEQATELIKAARTAGDTLGGIFEVIGYGLPIGLGTYGQWDERLDGRLAAAVMSIQSIKGVELGDAFANAAGHGSEAHDIIDYDARAGLDPADAIARAGSKAASPTARRWSCAAPPSRSRR